MCESNFRSQFDNLFDGTAPLDEHVRSSIEMTIERMTDRTKCNCSGEFVQEVCAAIKEKVWKDTRRNLANNIAEIIISCADRRIVEELNKRNCFRR